MAKGKCCITHWDKRVYDGEEILEKKWPGGGIFLLTTTIELLYIYLIWRPANGLKDRPTPAAMQTTKTRRIR
jgi:hypothetical protein